MKCYLVTAEAEAVHQHEGGGKGGVAAEIDLHGGREPAKAVAFRFRDEEGGFGQIVFCGDRLERRVRQPLRQRADGGGIPTESAPGKGVDLK